MTEPAYDRIGHGYSQVRRPDSRLAQAIWKALGDARTVLNVGAGTGAYEPTDRWVLAAEPSEVMIAQRPGDAAPVVRAPVETLPLADHTVDAAMAILTLHHWNNVEAGLGQLLRVVRDRIVILTLDLEQLKQLWIVRDYLPELGQPPPGRFPTIKRLSELLPNAEVEVLPVPRDCSDQFMAALWARPHAYLDPAIRAATSPWHDIPTALIEPALVRLREDLETGRWQCRYGDLLTRTELDVGLRLITSRKDIETDQMRL